MTLLVVGLVLIVRLGIHLPTIFRGFLFYIQVSSVAVAYLPVTFRLRADVVSYNQFKKSISESVIDIIVCGGANINIT